MRKLVMYFSFISCVYSLTSYAYYPVPADGGGHFCCHNLNGNETCISNPGGGLKVFKEPCPVGYSERQVHLPLKKKK
jgi:hypothetical protein